LLIVAIIVGAVWYFPRSETRSKNGGRSTSGAAIPVGVSPVVKGDMPIILTQLGTVAPLAMVTVKTQISGYLTQVEFREGQMVKAGDFLAQIDPRPYEVALELAQAQLAKDQALLKNAQLDLVRYNNLVAQNSIAKQTRDTQESLVGQYLATVKADQAQIDAQNLNLTYCHIVAPVTGRVGLRQVDAGNYVQTSDPNGIVVVTQLQPISKLRAIFDNKEESLFPNQFVNVKLLVDTLHGADIVSSSAIQRGAPGTFVYVMPPDHTVAVRRVKVGPTDGQRTAVLSGLQPGENIVIDGTDRLRDGAKVTVASPHHVEPGGQLLAAPQNQQ
jgi:multidrug efflux system membrane fusion protein